MTVPVQTPYSASTANGVTTVFPYGFQISDETDLTVTLDGVVQVSGYTVSGVGNPSGGNVTFTTAPANGVKVVRYLAPILKRTTDYQQFGDWLAAVVNLDFDRIWYALQMLQQNDVRSLKLPVDTSVDQALTQDAATRAGKLVGFDASGNMMLSVPADFALQTVSAFIATLLDDTTAAAARATLEAAARSANADITSMSALTAITTIGGVDIKGTNTNAAAAAGDVGEYIESTAGATNAPVTGTWGEITSIDLTAGDWDIELIALVTNNGATVQSCNVGIGTALGNNSTGVVAGDTRADGGATSATDDLSLVVPCKRILLNAPATYYLKVSAAYTAGTPQFTGRISARRRR